MAGRPKIPTDHRMGPLGGTRPKDFFTTTHRAIVVSVDSTAGQITAQFEDTAGQRADIDIPFGFLSSPANNRRLSAWSRYIPQEGDIVVLAFDTDYTPRIVSYSLISYELLSTLNDATGYQWGDLQPGEWDQRSCGGAYFRGDRTGLLFLAGGLSSISIDKKRFEIRSSTGLDKLQTNQSVWRRGLVKRTLVPFTTETTIKFPSGGVPANPANAAQMDLYESTTDLRSPVPGSPLGFPMAFMSLGNVLNPELSTALGDAYGTGPAAIKRFPATTVVGSPPTATARFFARIYASDPVSQLPVPTGIPAPGSLPFEAGIDQVGNFFVNSLGLGAQGGVRWWCGGPKFEIAAIAEARITAPLVRLGGLTATTPSVNGTLYASTLTTFFEAMVAAAAALEASFGTPAGVVAFAGAVQVAAQEAAAAIPETLLAHILTTAVPEPPPTPNILTG
jgi:hypothetical protein